MPGAIDLVVTDPAEASRVLATDPDYVARAAKNLPPGQLPGPPVALYAPRASRMLAPVDGRCAWIQEGGLGEHDPITFLGTLRRPDGAPRLVAIRGCATNAYDLLADTKLVVLPYPKVYDPRPPVTAFGGSFYGGWWKAAVLRGGVVDPRDPSHVIIEFDVYALSDSPSATPQATGVLDRYLQDDDSITFQLRETAGLANLGVRLRRTNMKPAKLPTRLGL